MDDYQNEAMPVGAAEVAAATQTLQRYKAGKAALDRRLVDNELWFRMVGLSTAAHLRRSS